MQAKVKLTLHFTHTHPYTHTYVKGPAWLLQSKRACEHDNGCECACKYEYLRLVEMMTWPHCLSFIEPGSTKHKRIELLHQSEMKSTERWNGVGASGKAYHSELNPKVGVHSLYNISLFDCRHVWAYTIGI